jgi:polysaccharide export outer membrane protein
MNLSGRNRPSLLLSAAVRPVYVGARSRRWGLFKAIILSCLVLGLPVGAWARQAAPKPAPAAALPTALSATDALTYELGPGDRLNIITFDEEQLTGTFYVGSNGAVSLPWIGDVPASGKTEAELRDDITARLKDGYILNPQVSVQVVLYRPFYILGEVNRPGEYPYVSGLTVRQAVATAQGFTYRANTKKVLIKRTGIAAEIKLPLTSTTEVEPGDTIRIVERYF